MRWFDIERSHNLLYAPAKLTLGLKVIGLRDDGYHLIDSEMVSVSLFDTLEYEPASGSALDLSIVDSFGSEEIDFNICSVALDSSNTITKGAALFGMGGHCIVYKRIPPGGGLGGGSSDVAAMIRYCTSKYEPLLNASELSSAILRIGADVPFCVGVDRAFISGIGEVFAPGVARRDKFVLFLLPVHSSTPQVYRRFDEMGPNLDSLGELGKFENDLESAAIAVSPILGRYRSALTDRFKRVPSMAGSGSTYFCNGDFDDLDLRAMGEVAGAEWSYVDFGDDGLGAVLAVSVQEVHRSDLD